MIIPTEHKHSDFEPYPQHTKIYPNGTIIIGNFTFGWNETDADSVFDDRAIPVFDGTRFRNGSKVNQTTSGSNASLPLSETKSTKNSSVKNASFESHQDT